jgi:hypothetical protein
MCIAVCLRHHDPRRLPAGLSLWAEHFEHRERRYSRSFSEARILSFRGELYNAFNHTQISSYNTSFQFNAAGQQLNPALGQANGARPPRNVQISARFVF